MTTKYPTQYYAFHHNTHFNFQLNRFMTWAGPSAIVDFERIAPRIHDFKDWKRELLALAEEAAAQERTLNAAYYYRAAEFFIQAGDPQKEWAYHQFIQLIGRCFPIPDEDRFLVPYEGGCLPVIRLRAPRSRGTLLVHGGFDSFIEEFIPVLLDIRDAGYEIIAFEGPGQGAALKKYHLPMTYAWEKPVKAILDTLRLEDLTLIGISLGGYLATRAAAFEPRIQRLVAYDVMYDFLSIVARRRPKAMPVLRALLKLSAAPVVNALVRRMAAQDLMTRWAIGHGMYVTGAETPFAYLTKMQMYTTRQISERVNQDCLVLAGSEDHFIPVEQFYQQIAGLKNARSLTARLYTRADQAQNHCQVGNIGLALNQIITWLETCSKPKNERFSSSATGA